MTLTFFVLMFLAQRSLLNLSTTKERAVRKAGKVKKTKHIFIDP